MVELKLDTAAVEKMFPEGTELRVNLQQAVVNNIAKKVLDKHVSVKLENCIRDHVQRECGMYDLNTLVQRELEKQLEGGGYGRNFKLSSYASDNVRVAVVKHVKNVSDSEFTRIINEALSKATTTMKNTIDLHIEQAIRDVNKHLANRLNTSFNSVVDAAIAAKLGMEVKK